MRLERMIQVILEHSAGQMEPEAVDLELLEAAWPALIGPEYARWTRPRLWQSGELTVEVDVRRWDTELQWKQNEMMKRVTQRFPWPIRVLHYRVVHQFIPLRVTEEAVVTLGERRKPRPQPPVNQEEQREAMEAMEHMDEELRERAMRLHALVRARDPSSTNHNDS